jgi:hypothetical protein
MDENTTPEKFIAGYRALAEFLTGQGFPVSHSTMAKYCSPAINTGPPSEGYWGRYPALARARMRPVHQPNAA